LLVIFLIIVLQPIGILQPLELMKQAQQSWVAPLQGLVTASLGAFYWVSANMTSRETSGPSCSPRNNVRTDHNSEVSPVDGFRSCDNYRLSRNLGQCRDTYDAHYQRACSNLIGFLALVRDFRARTIGATRFFNFSTITTFSAKLSVARWRLPFAFRARTSEMSG
jgi:hypothetical protein